MLRRILILLAPLVFIAFTGCGGDDQDTAPPTSLTGPEHPDDMASRLDLQNKMRAAKSSCVEAFAPAVMAAAPIVFSQPGVPIASLFQPGSPVSSALASTQPQQAQCVNNLDMAIYNITKMNNGKYWPRKDVQDWFYGNLGAIGDRTAAFMPPQALANPQFITGIRGVGSYIATTYVVPQLNDPRARYQATQQLNR